MAAHIAPRGSDGSCCECGEWSECECGDASCSLICESKSFTATLCGFEEVIPSTPPRRYLRLTFSGSVQAVVYFGEPCSESTGGTFSITLSGVAEYDPETCTLISEGEQSVVVDGGSPSVSPLTGPTIVRESGCLVDAELQRLSVQHFATGDCCPTGPGLAQIHTTSNRREQLSQEDTEDDAEARATEGLEWVACESPCVCATLAAYRDERTTGITFGGRTVRVKAVGSDLTPSSTYNVLVRFFRRALGSSGPFIFYAEQYLSSVATGPEETTKESDWVDVPNEAGWETVAGNCAFQLIDE